MAKPTVTIIIVAMNDELYIRETIESVLSQDYAPLEVHVQHSSRGTDQTMEIVHGYPVQWRSESDTGLPDAVNRGFRATTGDIVMVLGADDPLVPGSVSNLVAALDHHPEAGFVYGDIEYIDAQGKPFFLLKGRPLDLDDLFWYNHVTTQSVAMRRSAAIRVGLYRTGIINADWDMWLRLGAAYPATYVPKLLARYRVHSGSTSLNNLSRMAWSICWVVDTLMDDPMVRDHLRKGPNRAYAGSYLMASALFVLAGESRKAFDLYRRAIAKYPRAALTRRGLITLGALILGPDLFSRLRRTMPRTSG